MELGVCGKQRKKQWQASLNAAGMYRHKSHRGGHNVSWIVFLGEADRASCLAINTKHDVFGDSGPSRSKTKRVVFPPAEGASSSSERERDESAHTAAGIPHPVAKQRWVLAGDLVC